ncbi:MAG: cytochrome c biogenesis CcdA family protein [Hyphomicrobiaceae bacterium]|nr:cytochrome c biogenesis CcdA family protein [Hyphomicrobiaceae bacterium]
MKFPESGAMDLLFGYGAGLLTLINPCVLPVLPFILGAAVQEERLGPLALCAGLSVAFVVLGVGVAALGPAIGLDADAMARVGAVAMIGFGLVLLIPALNVHFATATAGIAGQAFARRGALQGQGLSGQLIGGMLLGAAWSPCIGPTLGGAISLAAQGKSLIWATAIMASFAAGASTVILALAYGTREALSRRQEQLRGLAGRSKSILAAALIAVGLAMLFGLHQRIEGWALSVLPIWLQELSVSL